MASVDLHSREQNFKAQGLANSGFRVQGFGVRV